jgi:peptidyl-dipeptidase Dcp
MSNILLNRFSTPFESVPFQDIKQEDFQPAIEQLIEATRQEVEHIATATEAPDFMNTIEALEACGKQLNRVTEAFFNLTSAETNDYLEKVQEAVSPLLAAFSNDITLNEALFNRIKSVWEQTDKSKLSTEARRLLDKTYKRFTRNGALLSAADKETLRSIDQELAALNVKFAQNVLQETNAYVLHLRNEDDLAGIPDSIQQQAKSEAQRRGLDGWAFTLQYPSMVPFLTYASNRDLRKELYMANGTKAFKDNEQNNEPVIQRITALRHQRARLLGFASHAAFVLEERMAGKPDTVLSFLNDLLVKARPFAEKDIESLRPIAIAEGIEEMMPYDHAYLAEKLRQQKFDYSEEKLKPYFPLHQVLNAAFDAAQKLFGLQFAERSDIQKYHEEVTVYEVLDRNNSHKALLYTDWHPREGKRAGAWMTSYKGQYQEGDKNHRPHISIVCNFSRPTADQPSLLTFNEVTTLFHEFGHALHGMLANTKYEELSGTNVYWDFVELPSQFMENYCYEPDFLNSFARHFKTGEILPKSEINKIVASANFMEGYQTLRQISFGLLDMAYHSNPEQGLSVAAFEQTVTKPTQLYPVIEGVAMSPSFSHIFSGGYAAGYYSYKWSEVLDADAFGYFKETGIFNTSTAARWEILLSRGGTEDPMELYIAFRGRKPDPEALLKRAGLN